MKEATARIKINKLLEAAGWRFFQDGSAPANIRLEPSVTIKSTDLDAFGDNFEKTTKGFVDSLLLDARGFPLLVLDKSLAKAADTIAFFKVENDGFGLGAQRRAFDKNDLPQIQVELAAYLQTLRSKGSTDSILAVASTAQIVPKEKIAANGDYNLSGERYREGEAKTNIFPLVKISEVCTVNPRKSQLAEQKPDTRVSFVPMADLNEHHITFQPSDEKQLSEVSASYTYFEDNDVLLAKVTPCFENGKAGIARGHS